MLGGSRARLRGEQLLQQAERGAQRGGAEAPELAAQALAIDRAELVEGDEAVPLLKSTRHSPRVGVASRGHRRHDHGAQVAIELIRRYHDAGPRLADLTPPGRVERDEEDIAASRDYRHSHSSASNRVVVGASNS